MDVDNDIDSQLLQQFSSIQTTDREELVAEFQRLLGYNIPEAGCIFFLDMNNWNLQAAVCSYFECGQPNFKVPQMSFVNDVTIGEGESVQPNTKFIKTWRVQNSGVEPWPNGCYLKFVAGKNLADTDSIMVQMLPPGAVTDISVEMISPMENGFHQSQWRMCTADGLFFGECIWVILHVDQGGVLGVTQLLSQFGCSEFARDKPSVYSTENPFMNQSPNPKAVSPFTPADMSSHQCSQSPQKTENFSFDVSSSNRHSSLPSSPHLFGDIGSSLGRFSTEALHQRPFTFQIPENSPNKATNSSKSNTNSTPPDMDLDL